MLRAPTRRTHPLLQKDRMPNRDGDVDAFYGSIDPMELLLIRSVTSKWQVVTTTKPGAGEDDQETQVFTPSFTVWVSLSHDADETLDHEMKELSDCAIVDKTGPREYSIRFDSAAASSASIRLAVHLFYLRNDLPKRS